MIKCTKKSFLIAVCDPWSCIKVVSWIWKPLCINNIYCCSLSPQVLQSLISLVSSPQPEHPLRADLAEEYSKDRARFMKNAEEYTKKHSEKRPVDWRHNTAVGLLSVFCLKSPPDYKLHRDALFSRSWIVLALSNHSVIEACVSVSLCQKKAGLFGE